MHAKGTLAGCTSAMEGELQRRKRGGGCCTGHSPGWLDSAAKLRATGLQAQGAAVEGEKAAS